MRSLYTFVLLSIVLVAAAPAQTRPAGEARAVVPEGMNLTHVQVIPVQYEGRVMPLDTLARQVARQVTGRQKWQGHDPVALLLAMNWQGQAWNDQPLILVGNPVLQAQIALPADRKYFSYNELAAHANFMKLLSEASRKAQARADLEPNERASLEIWERMHVLSQAVTGELLRVLPPVADSSQPWTTLAARNLESLTPEQLENVQKTWADLRAAFLAGDERAVNRAAKGWAEGLAELAPAAAPDRDRIAAEFFYNRLRPFLWGWVLAAGAMTAGLLAIGWPKRWISAIAWFLLVDSLAVVTIGIALRWWIAGHAPLATMYESLVFMGWGAIAMGLIVAAVVRFRAALPIMAGVAAAILVIADITPLDAAVSPLVPVLRNTAWLTYHVLTIMLAYSAFALAMGVGHVQAVALAYERGTTETTAWLNRLIYGIIIVGSAFLAAGIIFGAIWANKSWGRYWGWDPKETWSLITLLGYMAVLHGRLVGWIRPFGFAVASIVCFQLVLMTYYGVNFVLGMGLHSYGFGSGGLGWVLLYVLAECGFLLWTWLVHLRQTAARPAPAKAAA